jgi:hypothetical protein
MPHLKQNPSSCCIMTEYRHNHYNINLQLKKGSTLIDAALMYVSFIINAITAPLQTAAIAFPRHC